MPQLPLYDLKGKSAGEISASDAVFAQEAKKDTVHSALIWDLASRRRGTHSTLTKGEVRGGGRKPWRQKGTGRARVGSIRSPLWRKGGVTFGPKPRKYLYSLPKKIRKLALRTALSDKVKNNKVKVIDKFELAEAKTKLAAKLLKDLGLSGKTLIALAGENKIFTKAARNLKGVKILLAQDINIYDLLLAEWVVAEKGALARLEEVLV